MKINLKLNTQKALIGTIQIIKLEQKLPIMVR
jgi:hypothetical protein